MKVGVSTSSFGFPDDAAIRYLQEKGADVHLNPHGRRLTKAEAAEFVADLDGLIAGLEPLDAEVLGSAQRLRALARLGIGMDNVDQRAAQARGIRVSNTPEPPTDAVAELTLAAALALVRELPIHFGAMRQGKWEKKVSGSLMGATVHVIGYGRIGRRVVELLAPFGARILVTDPALSEETPAGVEVVELEAGLGAADVVTLHVGGGATILGAAEISAMKHGALLLNAARGGLVKEDALERALAEGRLGAAWFDTLWEEPYSGSLLRHAKFYASPHVGTYTGPCRRSMEIEAARNLVRDLGL